jgi:spore coat protein U-like protein
MKIPGLLVAIALSCIGGPVQAVNFNMTCTASSSTLAFNPYDVLAGSAVTTPTGSVTVTCTNTANSAVTVNYSLALSTSPTRQLTSGSNTLQYDLYTDPAPSAVQWGTTGTCTAGSNTNAGNLICGSFSVPGKGSASQTKNYYGKISANADVPVGTYAQSGIAVTLTYSCNPAPTGGGVC